MGPAVAGWTGPGAEEWLAQEVPLLGVGGEMDGKTLPGLWDLPVRFVSNLYCLSFHTYVGVEKWSG